MTAASRGRLIAGRMFRRVLPPRARLRWIAMRNWTQGEAEIHLVPELCDPGKASLDVGACLGTYAYFMRRHSHSVIALEPHPVAAAWLRRAFGDSIQVLEIAASDATGRIVLRIPREPAMTGMATVEPSNSLRGIPVEPITVAAVPLDALPIGRIGLVKIDVEGHESAVLGGATAIIERDHPAFIIEAEERHRPGAVSDVTSWLGKHGYDGWYLRGGRAYSISGFRAERDQPIDAVRGGEKVPGRDYVNNFFFVHRDDPRRQRLLSRMRVGAEHQ